MQSYGIDIRHILVSFLISARVCPICYYTNVAVLTHLNKGGSCQTVSNCTMTISFTGVNDSWFGFGTYWVSILSGNGITLYAVNDFAPTFNASIDGSIPTTSHFDGIPGCCPFPYDAGYNLTIYEDTSLSLGNHTLLLTLLNSTEGYISGFNSCSVLFFDFALVNGTNKNPLKSGAR